MRCQRNAATQAPILHIDRVRTIYHGRPRILTTRARSKKIDIAKSFLLFLNVPAILEFCLAPFSVCTVINFRTIDTSDTLPTALCGPAKIQCPGRVAQSVACLTRKSEVPSLIPGPATFVEIDYEISPTSTGSRWAVVSYWQKYGL